MCCCCYCCCFFFFTFLQCLVKKNFLKMACTNLTSDLGISGTYVPCKVVFSQVYGKFVSQYAANYVAFLEFKLFCI